MPLPTRNLPVRPVGGMIADEQAQNLTPEQSPDMQNFQVYQGVLRKRPGYSQYPSAVASIGGRVCGLYSTHDIDDVSYLFVAWEDGIALYNTLTHAWDALTGGPLTGANTKLFSWATSQESVVFSQGVDAVQIIDLTAPTTFAGLSADAPPAKYITRFADRLFLGFTFETATNRPYRIRWSINSDHTDWTGIGSGFRDNTEEPYFIRQLRKLQNSLAVYTERSIWLGERTGVASAPTRYTLAASDVGLYAPFTLDGFRESQFFLGNDNFYLFNGGAPVPFGDSIRDAVFNRLNPKALENCWSITMPDTQEYLSFLCEGDSNYPTKVWAFNYGRRIWYPWVTSGHTCGVRHRLDSTVTIDDLLDTIDDQGWLLDDIFMSDAYPALLTGKTDGKIYRWSTTYFSDNGAAIDAYWTSKDFTTDDVAEGFSRHFVGIVKVGVSYRDPGSPFTLLFSYSSDGGATWSTEESETMGGGQTGSHGDATWFKEATEKRLRIRIRNNSATENPQLLKFYFDLKVDSQTF